jgi:hypothetical protein
MEKGSYQKVKNKNSNKIERDKKIFFPSLFSFNPDFSIGKFCQMKILFLSIK